MIQRLRVLIATAIAVGLSSLSVAQSFVDHSPTSGVYGQPSDITQREPDVPREDETATIYFRVGYQFTYSSVAVYYTTDGSTPAGNIGFGSGTTQVLNSFANQVNFLANENTGSGVVDWWKATLPANARAYGTRVRYFIQAWGGTTSQQTGLFEFTNKIAWPGQGSNYANHAIGYPPVHFWKEEAVAGNGYINTMLDQNGSVYDVYYPSAGAMQGVAAKNEGYVDGLDTFPPGLPIGSRGQLNLNAAFAGIRWSGKTYWLTNEAGSDYTNWTHEYVTDTQTVKTTSKLVANGANFDVQQYDFAPDGITFPNDTGGNPNRGIHIKRLLITNNTNSSQSLNVYFYMNPALNGGDNFDAMFADSSKGAMCAYDNTFRFTSSSGEYNPTSFGDMTKNVSLYLAASMKALDSPGGATGTAAPDSWRDTSSDNSEGWIGQKITIAAGATKEVNVAVVGGFDNFAGASGTYNAQIAPALAWFQSSSMGSMNAATDAYWQNWLASGTTVDTPDDQFDSTYKRGLLATALHLDGKSGAVVAGMHNGAYMYCWPRDAVWAAITLARTGHHAESANVYKFLRETAYRSNESWGKGFFYQKYSTDGYQVWTAPQVDETAAVPWGAKFHFDCTGDTAFLNTNYIMIRDSAKASSEDSAVDSRLYYDDTYNLMNTMNLWEDQFGLLVFSNASCVRALLDAASLANRLGYTSDANQFNAKASLMLQGVKDRLTWNGENTDISLLGATYPFNVLSATDPLMVTVLNRINGTATDRYGNNHPIVNTSGEFSGLVNRYWGDSYWNGGPWFLSTMWYGMHYLQRSDLTAGYADIDLHKARVKRTMDYLGKVGFGAEQMSPSNSLLYSGQSDFRLQAAWPNAWESMSFYVDSIAAFLGYVPDAATNTLRIAPRVPSDWRTITFNNVVLGAHRFNVVANESRLANSQTITNKLGGAANFDTYIRIPVGANPARVTVNGINATYTLDPAAQRVHVTGSLATGVNAKTDIVVYLKPVTNGGVTGPTKPGGSSQSGK